ncbi:hypothetical protein [Saccharomonospora glauca]|nr:hypothetical protein [Saccharomonospora glauca]
MRGPGELEATVVEMLWHAAEPIKVRDLLKRLPTMTAILTVLAATLPS